MKILVRYCFVHCSCGLMSCVDGNFFYIEYIYKVRFCWRETLLLVGKFDFYELATSDICWVLGSDSVVYEAVWLWCLCYFKL